MNLALATFKEDGKSDTALTVHFNPASLKLAIANTIPDEGGGASQTKSKSTSKLDLELVFDSTDTGNDVRETSDKLKKLGFLIGSSTALPKVVFEWGTFSFTGVIESLNETFEFFSEQGVPLRETVAVSLKGLKLDERRAAGQPGGAPTAGAIAPGNNPLGTTALAQGLGNPAAGRSIAAQNGLESMRFPGSAPLAVGGDIPLKGPSGLSPPQTSLPMSAGGTFGALASAGVSAKAGAFAGLGAKAQASAGISFKADAVVTAAASSGFDLSGRLKPAASPLFNVR